MMKTQPPAKSKQSLKWLFILIFVCILGFIGLYYLYAFHRTKQITSKWFLLGKPIKSFHSSKSFRGDGCTVKIFRIPRHLQKYFTNPPPTFFNYPQAPLNRKIFWESLFIKNWTTGIPTREEAALVQRTLKNWNVPTLLADTVKMSLNLETSHHAHLGLGQEPGPGQSHNPTNFDYFILDPLNGWLIIIVHEMKSTQNFLPKI